MTDGGIAHPVPSGVPITDDNGNLDRAWYSFFVALWQRTGGNGGTLTTILDNISDSPGAMLYRGAASWSALAAGAPNKILQMGAAFPEWDALAPSLFGAQLANSFMAAPAGANGSPAFRLLAGADLNSVAGQIPGTPLAALAGLGIVGEYVSSQIASGSAVALTTTVAADITSISLTPGDWDIWGTIATNAAVTSATGWISAASTTDPGAPNAGAYAAWGAQTLTAPIGRMALAVSVTTTIRLSIKAVFGGSVSAFGFIGARRAR